LADDVPLAWAARDLGEAVGIRRPMTEHQRGYADVFGVEVRELPDTAYIEELVILDDHGFNDYKRRRWQKMRALLRAYAGKPAHPGVMLVRGNSGENRKLVNEAAIADHLSRQGFEIVNPGVESFDAVVNKVASARIVVGVEGSHLAHGLQGIADGGSMVVLQPPFRFNNIYKERCNILGLKYAFCVGHAIKGGFRVDVSALDRRIDAVSAQEDSVTKPAIGSPC